ncbi:MAG: hypothetical protein AVDCRST_MAG20-2875, partial [uncultured Acidimicrobiales bacterium]
GRGRSDGQDRPREDPTTRGLDPRGHGGHV